MDDPSAPTPWEIRRALSARMVPMRPVWRLVRLEDDLAHVIPTLDQIIHSVDEDCVCGPSAMLAPGHEDCDHSDIWVHQHHALDGRDLPVLR